MKDEKKRNKVGRPPITGEREKMRSLRAKNAEWEQILILSKQVKKGLIKLKKYNIEVNWHGEFGSDGWQIVNDEPFTAVNQQAVEEMIDCYWLKGCLSADDGEGGAIEIPEAEYRIVEIKKDK